MEVRNAVICKSVELSDFEEVGYCSLDGNFVLEIVFHDDHVNKVDDNQNHRLN